MGLFRLVNTTRGFLKGKRVVHDFVSKNPQYEGKEKELLILHNRLLMEYDKHYFCKGLETVQDALYGKFEGDSMEELVKFSKDVLSVNAKEEISTKAIESNAEIKYQRSLNRYLDVIKFYEKKNQVAENDKLPEEDKVRLHDIYFADAKKSSCLFLPEFAYSKSQVEKLEGMQKCIDNDRDTVLIPLDAVDTYKHLFHDSYLDMPSSHSDLQISIDNKKFEFLFDSAFVNKVWKDNEPYIELTFKPFSVRFEDEKPFSMNEVKNYIMFKDFLKEVCEKEKNKQNMVENGLQGNNITETREEKLKRFKFHREKVLLKNNKKDNVKSSIKDMGLQHE